jgi:transcription elongation factor
MSGSITVPAWNNSSTHYAWQQGQTGIEAQGCNATLNALTSVSYNNVLGISREDQAYKEGLCNDLMYAIAAAGG